MSDLTPAAHRALFDELLRNFVHVVAPSTSAAQYMRAAFPAVDIKVISHPEGVASYPVEPRVGSDHEVVLLGALGPHKGSAKLLEIAQLARLRDPRLRFRIIGYTDIDDELLKLGNVIITGSYLPEDLRDLLSNANGRMALFLSCWPETFSYTLSEVVKQGFIPLVPDIGALAERVRAAGFGQCFPFQLWPPRFCRRSLESPRAGELFSDRGGTAIVCRRRPVRDANKKDFGNRKSER